MLIATLITVLLSSCRKACSRRRAIDVKPGGTARWRHLLSRQSKCHFFPRAAQGCLQGNLIQGVGRKAGLWRIAAYANLGCRSRYIGDGPAANTLMSTALASSRHGNHEATASSASAAISELPVFYIWSQFIAYRHRRINAHSPETMLETFHVDRFEIVVQNAVHKLHALPAQAIISLLSKRPAVACCRL